jgi:ribosome-associated protein
MNLEPALEMAIKAALGKKAEDAVLLDLRQAAAFTDYFLLLSGTNPKQLVAIADAILDTLKAAGRRPDHVEGYPRHEWILLDYGSFVVHVFTPRNRDFYDLERLWGAATRVELAG